MERKGRRRDERRRRGAQGSSEVPLLATTCTAAWLVGREDNMREGESGDWLLLIEIIFKLATSWLDSQHETAEETSNV